MKLRSLVGMIAVVISGNLMANTSPSELNASNEAEFRALAGQKWAEISPDVFQFTDTDGTIYRQGFGRNAAQFDLRNLSDELASVNAMVGGFNGADADLASLKAYQKNLSVAVETLRSQWPSVKPGPRSSSNQAGGAVAADVSYADGDGFVTACGFVTHQLADFYRPAGTGGTAAPAISSIVFSGDQRGAGITGSFYVSTTADGHSANNSTTATPSATTQLLTVRSLGNYTFGTSSLSTFSYVSTSGASGACTNSYKSFSQSATL